METIILPSRLQRILTVYHRYVEMGSVSPDFPYLNFSYLSITESNQADWANRMHYEQVGELLRRMIRHVSALRGEPQDRTFAWLSGFLAHVIMDITIHPIIELKVGDYRQNKQQHRLCEMHQDAYVWQRMGLGHIGCVERNFASLTSLR
ncbi:zinc dependent phospholipase C family protein [Vibrio sp. PP-XX7]